VSNSSEHGEEPAGSIKGEEFFELAERLLTHLKYRSLCEGVITMNVKMMSSGMLHRVVWYKCTDVSEVPAA
jgi:hypothetical protein